MQLYKQAWKTVHSSVNPVYCMYCVLHVSVPLCQQGTQTVLKKPKQFEIYPKNSLKAAFIMALVYNHSEFLAAHHQVLANKLQTSMLCSNNCLVNSIQTGWILFPDNSTRWKQEVLSEFQESLLSPILRHSLLILKSTQETINKTIYICQETVVK